MLQKKKQKLTLYIFHAIAQVENTANLLHERQIHITSNDLFENYFVNAIAEYVQFTVVEKRQSKIRSEFVS